MGRLLIVEGDAVRGTDKHNVSGQAMNPAPPPAPPTVPYTGVGSYIYTGAMTGELSEFVRIAGKSVALTSSRSSLDSAQDVPPGGHSALTGSGFMPAVPVPIAPTLKITDPIGVGRPSRSAGSRFVSAAGQPVLLDGDAIDTCDGLRIPANSTVSSSRQNFVSASG